MHCNITITGPGYNLQMHCMLLIIILCDMNYRVGVAIHNDSRHVTLLILIFHHANFDFDYCIQKPMPIMHTSSFNANSSI